MDSYKVTINLARMQNAQIVENKEGKKAILIPVEENDIFMPDKGGAYARFTMWGNRSGSLDEYGKSHTLKQDFGLSYIQSHPQFSQSAMIPFLGTAKPIVFRNPSTQVHDDDAPKQAPSSGNQSVAASCNNDLPF